MKIQHPLGGEIRAKPDVPAEVITLISHYANLFGLADWRIFLEMVDTIDGDSEADAQCHLAPDYYNARIVVRRGFVDDPQGFLEGALLHEVLHIVTADQDWAVERLIATIKRLAPKEEQAARDLWRHGDERTTERLARLLVLILPKP